MCTVINKDNFQLARSYFITLRKILEEVVLYKKIYNKDVYVDLCYGAYLENAVKQDGDFSTRKYRLKIKVLQRPLFCSLPSKLVLTCFFVFYLDLAGEHYLILLSLTLFCSLVSFWLSMLLTFYLELWQMETAYMVMYQLDW